MNNFITQITNARINQNTITMDLPSCPQDIIQAQNWQREIAQNMPNQRIGWKLGINKDYGAIYAPIYSHENRVLPNEGLMGYEIEIAIILGGDWHCGEAMPKNSYLAAGIEILTTALANRKDLGFLPFYADLMGNFSYQLGDKIAFDGALCEPNNAIEIFENDTLVFSGAHYHPDGNPLSVIDKFMQNPPHGFIGFACGDILTLGSISGISPISKNMKIRANINKIGQVAINLI